MRFSVALAAAAAATLSGLADAQQYAGDFINNSLPGVPGSEIAFFRIPDTLKKNNNLTLINYYSHGSNGNRIIESNIKRAIVVIHGLNEDPGTYMSNMLSALSQVPTSNGVTFDNTVILAPFFANGDEKNVGYPFTPGLAPGLGSTSNALVWPGSQWSAGGNNEYPFNSRNTSSYFVLDTLARYFDNATLFPNMKQIVIAGHSLGGQTVQRYAAIGQPLNLHTPLTLWTGNPDSLVWFNTTRPFVYTQCPTYDNYREGYTNFTQYPMFYGKNLVASGRDAILANYRTKNIAYARGILDFGDDSSTCAPFTTGNNRNERFFLFVEAFPPHCKGATDPACDTVDLINAGHDAGAMFASTAGQARLFLDNFNGTGNRAYDFGYPRVIPGDDPFPNPALVNTPYPPTPSGVFAGGMTYKGCWSDQNPATFAYNAYTGNNNTVEYCTSLCHSQNYTIAGLEFGTQCFCGNSLGYEGRQTIDESCMEPCAGNANETCGNNNRISVYSASALVLDPTPVEPATIGNFTYQGCWTDASSVRALAATELANNAMTLETCAAYCSNYAYFGTEYSTQCFCGNTLDSSSNHTADYNCDMTCAGNDAEFCGAANYLSLYQNPNYVPNNNTTPASSSGGSSSTASGLSCPNSNGTTYVSNNTTFLIECGIDHSGGDLSSLTTSTFQQCINTCATTAGCVDVSYSGSACYLKSSIGAAVNDGVWGARSLNYSAPVSSSTSTTTPAGGSSTTTTVTSSTTAVATATTTANSITCPASNGTTYVSGNTTFYIECGVDHSGGDLSSLSTNTFQQCLDTCAMTPQCVDVAYSGSACYLKSSIGPAVNDGVWGGRSLNYSAPVSSSPAAASSAAASTGSAASTTSTTVTAAPSSTAVGPTCPGSNGTYYTSLNNETFLIQCGVDHAGGDLSSLSVNSFQQCIDTCAQTSGCVDVSLSGSACYMKSSVGAPVQNGVFGALLVSGGAAASSSSAATSSTSSTATSSTSSVSATASSTIVTTSTGSSSSSAASPTSTPPTCPASNSTIYTAPNGDNFLIECGIDHAGGDLSSLSVSSLQQCINTCSTTQGCVDVSLSGSACYLKSSVGAAVYDGVYGARLIVSSSSASSSAAASTSTSSTPTTLVTSTVPATTSSSTTASSTATPSTITSSTTTSSTTTTSSSSTASATVYSCPSSNGTYYTSPTNGTTFLIQCGVDHSGGDLSMVYVNSLQACMDTCAGTTGCVDLSLSGSACYMKSSVGAPVNNGVWGALVVPANSTTSASTSASATASSTVLTTSSAAATTTA